MYKQWTETLDWNTGHTDKINHPAYVACPTAPISPPPFHLCCVWSSQLDDSTNPTRDPGSKLIIYIS